MTHSSRALRRWEEGGRGGGVGGCLQLLQACDWELLGIVDRGAGTGLPAVRPRDRAEGQRQWRGQGGRASPAVCGLKS